MVTTFRKASTWERRTRARGCTDGSVMSMGARAFCRIPATRWSALRWAEWWIQCRDATSQQNPIKALKEVTTGGQHDGHRVACWQITRLQSCRDRLRPGVEGGIGDLFCRIGQGDVETVRMSMHVPLQYLHQRPGVLGWGGSDVWHGAS